MHDAGSQKVSSYIGSRAGDPHNAAVRAETKISHSTKGFGLYIMWCIAQGTRMSAELLNTGTMAPQQIAMAAGSLNVRGAGDNQTSY